MKRVATGVCVCVFCVFVCERRERRTHRERERANAHTENTMLLMTVDWLQVREYEKMRHRRVSELVVRFVVRCCCVCVCAYCCCGCGSGKVVIVVVVVVVAPHNVGAVARICARSGDAQDVCDTTSPPPS